MGTPQTLPTFRTEDSGLRTEKVLPVSQSPRPAKSWIRFRPLLLLMPIVIGMAAWALWPVTVLEIRAGQEGRLVKRIPVIPGDRITYTYLHSVEKEPIDEILEVAPNGDLVVRETVYDMVGAGLPSDVLDGDFQIDPKDSRWHITNMSRDLPVMRVRVAFTAQQILEVRGEKFRLDSLASPTTLLVVAVVQQPRVAASLGL